MTERLSATIASLKAAIIIVILMQPAKERRLGVVFRLAGIFWLMFLLALLGGDYLTRSQNPVG